MALKTEGATGDEFCLEENGEGEEEHQAQRAICHTSLLRCANYRGSGEELDQRWGFGLLFEQQKQQFLKRMLELNSSYWTVYRIMCKHTNVARY